jgi:hypothetical protein
MFLMGGPLLGISPEAPLFQFCGMDKVADHRTLPPVYLLMNFILSEGADF